MARISKHIAGLSAALALLGVVAGVCGCGGGATLGTVTAVSITPTSGSVIVNQQLSFTASVTVAGQNNTTTTTPVTANTAVTWYVNGVSGGNATYGTIITDPSDVQVGIYTAPTSVPSVNSGQVTITATAQRNPNGTAAGGANLPVTSNAATITVSPGLGLQIISPPTTVPAGGSAQFNATLNGVADPNATWSVTSQGGGNFGSINANSGIYTAPAFPPPGDTVTVTASDRGTTATATVTITYADNVLNGSFAFAYTGNDSQGFLAAAGSFVTDGKGHILSGVEDISSFLTGVATQVQITGTSTYVIGVDGRGIANLDTSIGPQTFAFAVTTNQHAIITRFDSAAGGSGTMDLQTANDISSASAISGAYVFSAMGTDSSLNPEGIAGEFMANGGTISAAGSILDLHDGPSSAATKTALSADSTYTLDVTGHTGRGTLTLNAPLPTGSVQFAFYMVDHTQMYAVEIDNGNQHLAGKIYSAQTGSPGLASATYALTAGGSATLPGKTAVGPYVIGGLFVSNGSGGVSSGTLDINNQGTVTPAAGDSLSGTCGYTVDSASGRVDLKLCPSGTGTTTSEFALYPYQATISTQPQNFLILEIDANALSTGEAFEQTSTSALSSGGFALGLSGQGVSHGSRSPSAQAIDGHIAGSAGAIDVNFVAPQQNISTSATLGSPSTGRGTLVLKATGPGTFDLVYYLVSSNEALLLDQDTNSSLVLIGTLERQF